MKWLLLIIGIFSFTVLGVLILGLFQPAKHSVTRSVHLKQKPETVFAVLDNRADWPNWSSTVVKVEPLPDRDGKPVERCTVKWGRMRMIMTQLERTPPTRLVVSMAKEGGPALGMWTYQIAAETDGSRIALTEEGELKKSVRPRFRACARPGCERPANSRRPCKEVRRKWRGSP
jgi:hypothetical protein